MMRQSRLVGWLVKRFYRGVAGDDAHFTEWVKGNLPVEGIIIDVGCGRGINCCYDWRAEGLLAIGLDAGEEVAENSLVDLCVRGDLEALPFQTECCEGLVSVNVVEHLEHPEEALGNIWRILKPGGSVWLKMPNRNHYVGIIGRYTPHWVHRVVSRLRGTKSEQDTYPTWYRWNTLKEINRIAQRGGWEIVTSRGYEGVPEYLRWNGVLFCLGLVYERWVNHKEGRDRWKSCFEVELRKKVENE